MTIKVSKMELQRMKSHAVETYPEECCGILVGTLSNERAVKEAIPTRNTREDLRNNRYTIDPREIWLAEKKHENQGMGVIGFYHSHPNAPARPSGFDLENAWPMYSYLIMSVVNGQPTNVASWVMLDDRSEFTEEELMIEG